MCTDTMRRDGHSRTGQHYETNATHRTPDWNGSLLVTFGLVAALPAAMIALAYPVAIASLAFGAVVGLAAGGV